MSDTPRTDAVKFKILSDLQSGTRDVVDVEYARQFERELNAERRRILDRVQLMREGEADADLRCLISFIRNP